MTYNNTYEQQRLYFSPSRYSGPEINDRQYVLLPESPSNKCFEGLRRDVSLLENALSLYNKPQASTITEQIFGDQLRRQKISLKHLANVLHERSVLHYRHLKDIDRRLMDCQEKLSILKMHFPIDGGRSQQNLERLVIELEKQKRDEDINFWKDTLDIRQKLLEQAAEYSATRCRKDMLRGVEGENA
jgi:hypothetical protein